MPINSEVAQEVAKKAIFGFITWFHFPIVAIEALESIPTPTNGSSKSITNIFYVDVKSSVEKSQRKSF